MSRESLFANRVCSVRVRTVSSAPAPRADVGRTINVRLADFIRRDIERVIAKWEEFAATRLPAAASTGLLELRDHAPQILEAVALDLSTPQSPEEQAAKSKGLAPAPARETAAQTHAVMRARRGYDIKQLVSEYRALRASVLSLWMEECLPAAPHLQDVIRFNEAIDQAAVIRYSLHRKQLAYRAPQETKYPYSRSRLARVSDNRLSD